MDHLVFPILVLCKCPPVLLVFDLSSCINSLQKLNYSQAQWGVQILDEFFLENRGTQLPFDPFYLICRNLPFNSNISSATLVDHSWLIVLKNPLTSLFHKWLKIVQIFSNSLFSCFIVFGILFHKKRAFDLLLNWILFSQFV